MSEFLLPPSPQWYCGSIVDINRGGTVVYGARHDVVLLDTSQLPPRYKGQCCLHRDRITSVALSPSPEQESMCCSGAEDGKVKLWLTENPNEIIHEHCNHTCKISCITWSPLEKDMVVSGDDGGNVVVWRYSDNRIASFCPANSPIICMRCSNLTASHLAIGYRSGLILVVDMKADGEIVQRLRGHDEDVQSLTWCPIPGEAFKVNRKPDSDTLIQDESEGESNQPVDFGTEGHLLASGSKDKSIRIWSTLKGRQLMVLKVPKPQVVQSREDLSKSRMWITLLWCPQNPLNLVSSSFCGELLLWNLNSQDKQNCELLNVGDKRLSHGRMVFSLALGGPSNTLLCSVSMDRQIIFWDMMEKRPLCAIPTLGGFVYVAKTSPVDPGRLAIGVGDSMIRVWNLNNSLNMLDVTTYWQGIKAKVTALSWHPGKEGLLAYGTDDGRVGVYDTLSNKPPCISSHYHKKTVYVVAWGPPCSTDGDSVNSSFVLYSVGDGVILSHDLQKLQSEAKDINSIILETNGKKARLPIRSEISWNPDFSLVAIGNDDGSIEVFRPPTLQLVCTIHTHHKIVNTIQWHPYHTAVTPSGTSFKHYIATGSNEATVHIVDLTSVLDGSRENEESVLITQTKLVLLGHSNRIIGVQWSPHHDNQLASVSYDGTARVWDVSNGQCVSSYHGHRGRVLCVQWSELETDMLFSGGEDFSFQKWKMSDHPPKLIDKSFKRKKTKSKRKPAKEEVAAITLDQGQVEDLEHLIQEKKLELSSEHDHDSLTDIKEKPLDVGSEQTTENVTSQDSVDIPTRNFQKDREIASQSDIKLKKDFRQDVSVPKDGKKRKPFKPKSMFPLSGRHENRGKESVLGDILVLAKCIVAEKDGTSVTFKDSCSEFSVEDSISLGFFLPGKRAIFQCLELEGIHHKDNDNMEYFYQLEIWKGNINVALQLAREREELSDWLVAMAPLASFDVWTAVCQDYAIQLENEGLYHKAATYLLAAHKVYSAIELFKRHRLFKEAIALAKVRLSPVDPVLKDLYTVWANQLSKDGNFEQAAKCHLAMLQVQDAAVLLARRYSCNSSLQMAARISLVAGQKQQGLAYGYKLMQQFLVQFDWQSAYEGLQKEKSLQVLLAVTGLHELTVQQIMKIKNVDLPVEVFTFSKLQANSKVLLPDFILNLKDIDPISPWKPSAIDGHAFPHHVLRVWYSYFSISMDTNSLEDMYNTLNLLNAGRQIQVELSKMLIQVSVDLTLCLLSFLMSETPTAISHLLQAICNLHEAGHHDVMETILRLFLPQGPKYIFKLQQEVTAMRVMISMENKSDFDGTSRFHTMKRHLSEQKDEESSVSCSRLRCREIDCLKAYYYLAVLKFLLDDFCSDQNSGDQIGVCSTAAMVNDKLPQEAEQITDTQESQNCTVEKSDLISYEDGASSSDCYSVSNQETTKRKSEHCKEMKSDKVLQGHVHNSADNQNSSVLKHTESMGSESQMGIINKNQTSLDEHCSNKLESGNASPVLPTKSVSDVPVIHSVKSDTVSVVFNSSDVNSETFEVESSVNSEILSDISIVNGLKSIDDIGIANKSAERLVVESEIQDVEPDKTNGSVDGSTSDVAESENTSSMNGDICMVGDGKKMVSMYTDVRKESEIYNVGVVQSSVTDSCSGNDTTLPNGLISGDQENINRNIKISEENESICSDDGDPVIQSFKIDETICLNSDIVNKMTDSEAVGKNTGDLNNIQDTCNTQFNHLLQNENKNETPSSCHSNTDEQDSHVDCDSVNDSAVVGTESESTADLKSDRQMAPPSESSEASNESKESEQELSENLKSSSLKIENQRQSYELTISKLCHLSQGLLWDVQGKRFAFRNTLNYIEKAISQLSVSSGVTRSSHTEGDKMLPPWECHGNSTVEQDTAQQQDSVRDTDHDQVHNTGSRSSVAPAGQGEGHSLHLCNSKQQQHISGCLSAGQYQSAHVDQSAMFDPIGELESHLCPSEFLHKSRKVLFRDQSHSHPSWEHIEKGSSSNIINPAKYINVPDEWYGMSADQKYFMPYVTIATLKEEQEFMLHELKRGSDIAQAPFPNPIDSVILLQDVGRKYISEELAEKEDILKNIISWGLKFAVSSQQKYILKDLIKTVCDQTEVKAEMQTN